MQNCLYCYMFPGMIPNFIPFYTISVKNFNKAYYGDVIYSFLDLEAKKGFHFHSNIVPEKCLIKPINIIKSSVYLNNVIVTKI